MENLSEVKAKAQEMLTSNTGTEDIVQYLLTALEPFDDRLRGEVILLAGLLKRNKDNHEEKMITEESFIVVQNRAARSLQNLINTLDQPVREVPSIIEEKIEVADPTNSMLRIALALLTLILVALVVLIFLQLR